MIPDISELPWWAMLIITFASACAGYIIVIIFVRHKETNRKLKIKAEIEIEQAKRNINFASQKFEKLLNDYPTYYFIPEKLKDLQDINNEIQVCLENDSEGFQDLIKLYTKVFYTSFNVLSKYDYELMSALNEYTDSVDVVVRNKNITKCEKQVYVLQLVPYLQALDVRLPSLFNRYLPMEACLGKDSDVYDLSHVNLVKFNTFILPV